MFKKFGDGLKKAAAVTADVTKKAAAATSEFAKEQYNSAVARPTAVKCEKEDCKTTIEVPASLWTWTCASCSTANQDVKECSQCQAARPKAANPTLPCPTCGTPSTVYGTVAEQQTVQAARDTKKAVKDGAEWTQTKFVELKSRPTTVQCKMEACKLLLAVPPEVWEWQCDQQHANGADDKVCSTCQAKRPSFTPVLTCQCGAQVMVPSTAAKAQLDQGAAYTKEKSKQGVAAAKAQYSHWTSAPEEFNCQHCNEKLMVPSPTFWHCTSCGVQNAPDLSKCSQCSTKNKQEVMCGKCNQKCTIPDSNLANSARTAKLSAAKGFKKVQQKAKDLTAGSEEKKEVAGDQGEAPPAFDAPAEATPPAGAAQ